MKRLLASLFAIAVALTLLVSSTGMVSAAPVIDIQILNVSDWHGQLEPINVSGVNYGGAAYLDAYFDADRASNPNTILVTAGDAVGATPPLSSFFSDEPTILAMNMMGFQVDTFGNHNFDSGVGRLQTQIDLADFRYVSANLRNRNANINGVRDFHIINVNGIKVAFIGITNPEAPTLVFPGNFGTMAPTDPVAAAIRARNAARSAGAHVIIVLVHMGVTGFNIDASPYGPLIDFANAVGAQNTPLRKVDLIIGDHTDIQFSGIINGVMVQENRSKGLTYSRTVISVDSFTKKVLNRAVTFVSPQSSSVTPDPDILNLLATYNSQLSPIFSSVIGTSNVSIPRSDKCGQSGGRTCESRVGNVVTDAMRKTYNVDFAITNSGGLRDSLTCPSGYAAGYCQTYTPPPYQITRGMLQALLPFGNQVVTLTVNGAELKSILENGFSTMPSVNGRFPQVSGLCVYYDISLPAGSRITGADRQALDGSCTGGVVDLTVNSSYSIAMNDFMVNGGDSYPNFASRSVTRDIMVNVVADYVTANSPLSGSLDGRIQCSDSNGATAPNCPSILP